MIRFQSCEKLKYEREFLNDRIAFMCGIETKIDFYFEL